ncbi:MAG: gliding motility-associated C-terminal domain-containing protein, partial [Prevotellaceae bacterium]|nr:gliding motility-associated C-terminal domain-containing protein [Prevotellaceae bacterium]
EQSVTQHEVSRKPYTSPNYSFENPATALVPMPDTTYEETVPNIESQRQTYRIRAKNAADYSGISDAYLTIQFSGTYDACLNRINLRWTEYKRFSINTATGQIDETNTEANKFNLDVEYEVWGHAGDVFDLSRAEQLSIKRKQSQDIILPDPHLGYLLDVDTTYQLFVKAFLPGGDTATSHLFVISTENRRLPASFNIDSIISRQGILFLYFDVDRRTELDTFALYRSDIPYRPVRWFYHADEVTEYEDRDVSPGQIYSYNLVAFRCGTRALVSDTASNIIVHATPYGRKAKLIWTGVGNNAIYTLTRTSPSPSNVIFSGSDSVYIDDSSVDSLCFGPKTFCYCIESREITQRGYTVYSRSDTSCITLEQMIILPDAIDPKSTVAKTHNCNCTSDCTFARSLFGPIIDMDERSYQLIIEIFDRTGLRLFGTRKHFDEPLEKSFHYWNGRYKGEYVPAGAYVYSVRVEFRNRNPILLRGSVTVVYKP